MNETKVILTSNRDTSNKADAVTYIPCVSARAEDTQQNYRPL